MSLVEKKNKSSSHFIWKKVPRGALFLIQALFLAVLSFLLISSLLAATGVFMFQCFLWLRAGEWIGISAVLLLNYFLPPGNAFVQWLDNPQSWYGVHTLISGTPVVLFLILIAMISFCALGLIPGSWARHRRFLMTLAVGPAFLLTSVWVVFA